MKIVSDEITYAKAGVDRDLEEEAVKSIINIVKKTKKGNDELEGHYAGGITLGDKILSLTTDNVGSKVLLSQELKIYNTIGIDCVAMNVNDLITIGSIPAAFVDYIAIQKPNKEILDAVAEGLANGCIESETPLVGGETSIVPEILTGDGEGFDLSGTALGIHDVGKTISGKNIINSDIIIGISSSGVHSNGYSLVRKLFNKDEKEWLEKLLTPTRIYVKCIKSLLKSDLRDSIHGMAHITGGGFTNLLRLGNHHYKIDTNWEIPIVFKEIRKRSNLSDKEAYRTFNMGIGYILIVEKSNSEVILKKLNEFYPSQVIGVIEEGTKVTINGNVI